MPFARQCEFAASVGYDGLELAPFTFSDEPHLHDPAGAGRDPPAAEDAGLAITGLHWLLLAPKGLSITSADDAVRARTVDVMRRLIDLCADLGGKVLVHGSPGQRRSRRARRARPRSRGRGTASPRVADDAQRAGVVYCIEPLATDRDVGHQHDRRGGGDRRRGRQPGAADDGRHLRRRAERARAARRRARPLAADRAHRARAGERPQPARAGRGRRPVRADPRRAEARRLRRASSPSSRSSTCPTAQACAARAIGYVRGILRGARSSGCGTARSKRAARRTGTARREARAPPRAPRAARHARPGRHARRILDGGHARVRAPRARRRARRPHRDPGRREQADALLLLRRQGGLFLAVLEHAYASIRAAEQELRLLDRPPVEAIARLVEFTWRYYLDHPEFLTLLNSENLHRARHLKRSKNIRPMNSPLIETLGEVLRRGEAQGMFRSGRRPAAALHLDRRARLLLPVEQPHAVAGVRPRPRHAGRARGAARPHDRARHRLSHQPRRTGFPARR